MKTKHTPIPWEIGAENNGADHINVWMGIVHIASVMKFIPTGESAMANAEFITRACNSHYDLLDALELALEVIQATGPGSYPEAEETIKYAIAKAKGENP